MIKKANYDSALWGILEKSRLADLSQFHRTPLFDEVPLYSRQSDIAFLSNLPREEIDRILIGFSLKFLKSVIAYEGHATPYLAAITVWQSAAEDPIVPNIFVWGGRAAELHGKLSLATARSSFVRDIKRLVTSQSPRDEFTILEESPQSNEMTRAFISLAKPPYRTFLPLSKLV